MATTIAVTTLVEISFELRCSLDSLRAVVRQTPRLAALGKKIGNGKVYAPSEAEKIRREWRARRAK